MADLFFLIVVDFDIIEPEGEVPYKVGLDLQMECWKEVQEGGKSKVIFLEHSPTITLGRRTKQSHLFHTIDEYREMGIEVVKVDRGGSVTYHGPGQLVGYIITKVSKHGGTHNLVTKTMALLEKAIHDLGIQCRKNNEFPGIWTETKPMKKLAAIGMQIKSGVSLHGFAVNVDLDLEPFTKILPCGLPEPVSTLSIELGRKVRVQETKYKISMLLPDFLF